MTINHEAAEAYLVELIEFLTKEYELQDFEVVDMVLRHGLNLYLRGQCHDYADDSQSKRLPHK
jgi:hypothetical protein